MGAVRRFRITAAGAAVALVAGIVGDGIVGYPVYNKSRVDPVTAVDAIIVPGGEHDGREDYAFELARQSVSKNAFAAPSAAISSARACITCRCRAVCDRDSVSNVER